MLFKRIKSGSKVADKEFDTVFPEFIRELSGIYFTPINVAKVASKFLTGKTEAKILDIGSGSGKFCMVGAAYTNGHFTGVEQRGHLCQLSDEIAQRYHLTNTTFIHANVLDISFVPYDAFYLFNPFYENFMDIGMINDETALEADLYRLYIAHVRKELDKMPIGTKLATFFSSHSEVPPSYSIQTALFGGKLKLLIKTS